MVSAPRVGEEARTSNASVLSPSRIPLSGMTGKAADCARQRTCSAIAGPRDDANGMHGLAGGSQCRSRRVQHRRRSGRASGELRVLDGQGGVPHLRERMLAVLASRSAVAVESDELAVADGTAWSVLVRGFSREVRSAVPMVELLRNPQLVPWGEGPRRLLIAIEPESISGRRLTAPDG